MNTSKENRLLTPEVLAALANYPFLSQEKKDTPPTCWRLSPFVLVLFVGTLSRRKRRR